MLHQVIRTAVDDLRRTPQRQDYHPEKWVYHHEAYVYRWLVERSGWAGSKLDELRLVAMFHDIAKPDCTRRSSRGVITSYRHDEMATHYWDACAFALAREDIRGDLVRWMIRRHMDAKFADRMPSAKRSAFEAEGRSIADDAVDMIEAFVQADDMLAYHRSLGIDFQEAEADEEVEVLSVDEKALRMFDDFVERQINKIRSASEPADGDKALYLVRGLPGAGKTEFADGLRPAVKLAADDFFTQDGAYEFDRSKLPEAHAWCRRRASVAMADGRHPVVVHNTFTQLWEMIAYYGMAARNGYRVYSVVVENRHGGESVHGVPQNAINKMRNRFRVAL